MVCSALRLNSRMIGAARWSRNSSANSLRPSAARQPWSCCSPLATGFCPTVAGAATQISIDPDAGGVGQRLRRRRGSPRSRCEHQEWTHATSSATYLFAASLELHAREGDGLGPGSLLVVQEGCELPRRAAL